VSLHFLSLGSGSKGNATLVKSANVLLLVDCGFTLKETEKRLRAIGHQPEDITALLVTHEHGDHIKGVGAFARKHRVPVYLSHGTGQHDGLGKIERVEINSHRGFSIADIDVTPVAVPHDAREPCQFVFRQAHKTFGLLTDLGSITPFVIEQYQRCDALMLESNHDSRMLAMGPYPPSLKLRVGGQWGHLNNQQAAGLLSYLEPDRLQHVVISHLSEQNNTELLVREAISPVCGERTALLFAGQETGTDWIEVS
jgi:phosphoribosyl 1,2-cyclic phosphodiesterase